MDKFNIDQEDVMSHVTVGCLVFVISPTIDHAWYEVTNINGKVVTCTNGHGESFSIDPHDVFSITRDDSVLR